MNNTLLVIISWFHHLSQASVAPDSVKAAGPDQPSDSMCSLAC